jgi:hypothetical protein
MIVAIHLAAKVLMLPLLVLYYLLHVYLVTEILRYGLLNSYR